MRFECSDVSIFELSTYRANSIRELADLISSDHESYQSGRELSKLSEYVNFEFDFGVNLRGLRGATVHSKCERLKSSDYWYQQLTKISLKSREDISVRCQLLNDAQPCCSDETFESFLERQALRGIDTFRGHQANLERAACQPYLMAKAAACRAFEANFTSVFMTLGLDASFHSSSDSYTGKTFEDAYAQLSYILKAILDYLSSYGVRGKDFYGVRCVEVHTDGCPHFHVNLYIRPDLLSPLRQRVREMHYRTSSRMGKHFDAFQDEIIKIRQRGSLDSYCNSVAYIFKSSYAGRAQDSHTLVRALRQRAAINAYGKHQYELIGMNGKSELIKELSRRCDPIQVAKDLGCQLRKGDPGSMWLKAMGSLIFGKSNRRYSLRKEARINRYGEMATRTVDLSSQTVWGRNLINYSLIILPVICNSSRDKHLLTAFKLYYRYLFLFAASGIRAPPNYRNF